MSVRKTRPGHAHASYVGHATRTGCGGGDGGLEMKREMTDFVSTFTRPVGTQRTRIVDRGEVQKTIEKPSGKKIPPLLAQVEWF